MAATSAILRPSGNTTRGVLSVQPSQPALEPTELGGLVLTSAHRKLLTEIVDSLIHGTQFLALTGAPGVSKVTMAAAIYEELANRSVLVRRVGGCCGTGIHLRIIMSQFLGKPETEVDADDVERLFYAMTKRETPNERLVLIINDAERLLPDALAYLRLLVSVALERMPQIVFIGDPSFWDPAGQVSEAGFSGLITARFVLEPLNPTQTCEAAEEQLTSALRLDAIATERGRTQLTTALVGVAVARPESWAVGPANGMGSRLELSSEPTTIALAHAVPASVPEPNPRRPDRSAARIATAAAVVIGSIGAATYWLAPPAVDRTWTERRTPVGHRDGAEAASATSRDATIQIRLPFSSAALQSQFVAPDFDSASAFSIITFVPTPAILRSPMHAPHIHRGADTPISKEGTARLQERPDDYVSPSSKGIWLFPPYANGGG
jgi:type II secretory pathway predicted ATPase ExeA